MCRQVAETVQRVPSPHVGTHITGSTGPEASWQNTTDYRPSAPDLGYNNVFSKHGILMVFMPRTLPKGRRENLVILICSVSNEINTLILYVFKEGPGWKEHMAPVAPVVRGWVLWPCLLPGRPGAGTRGHAVLQEQVGAISLSQGLALKGVPRKQ